MDTSEFVTVRVSETCIRQLFESSRIRWPKSLDLVFALLVQQMLHSIDYDSPL